MKAVFIRHNLSTTEETLTDLWNRRLVALHYKNTKSIDPDDYDGWDRHAIRRLLDYCESGVIVGATYKRIKPEQMLIGIIETGSKIISTDDYGPKYIYKTVQLNNTKVISYIDYPLLAAIQPKGGTITGWPSAERCLQSVLGMKDMPANIYSLAPSQLEVLCYEYLRAKGILQALLLPIGRTCCM